MLYVSRQPCPALRDVVERIWWCKRHAVHGRETLLPSGQVQLLVNRHEDALHWWNEDAHTVSGAILAGPFDHPIQLDPAEQRDVLGVVFRPAGAAVFLRDPLRAVARTHVDLADLGLRIDEVRGPDPFAAVERALLRARHGHHVMALSIAARRLVEPRARLADIADDLGWSRRRLSTAFHDAVGLAPKRYGRVQRVQRALDLLRTGVCASEVALRLGFADQAHFNHDFRAITHRTPTHYMRATTPFRNHLS